MIDDLSTTPLNPQSYPIVSSRISGQGENVGPTRSDPVSSTPPEQRVRHTSEGTCVNYQPEGTRRRTRREAAWRVVGKATYVSGRTQIVPLPLEAKSRIWDNPTDRVFWPGRASREPQCAPPALPKQAQ
jgi:hypothetical protein